jgi:putative transposase
MELRENCLLFWGQGESRRKERLLWVNPQNGQRVFILAEGKRAWPFARSRGAVDTAINNDLVQLAEDDILAGLLHECALSPNSRARYETAYALIKPLVEDAERKILDPQLCGGLIQRRVQETGCNRGTLYKQLRRYWQRGQRPMSVQPDYRLCGKHGSDYLDPDAPDFEERRKRKRGRPRKLSPGTGANITKVDVDNFTTYLKRYLKPNAPPLATIWEQMLADKYGLKDIKDEDALRRLAFENGIPTLGQLRYFYRKHYTLVDILKAKEGDLNYLRKHRPTLGDATKQASYPGALYQIDNTTADICLVHSKRRNVLIGRPILYLVVDTLTTLIAGFHVTFENPFYNAAALALWNAYCDKVKFCADIGMTIKPEDWPSYGLPTKVLADRGEMLSHASDGLIQQLGVGIATTAPYRADAKPLVERMFGQVNSMVIRWLEGAKPRGQDPSRDDYRKLARLPEDVFIKILVETIITYNKSIRKDYWLDQEMIAAGVQTRPVALWAWGMRNLTGMMKHMDEASVRVGLMPLKRASVTESGIVLDKLYYHAPPDVAQEWMTRARNRGHWHIHCGYDPNTVDYIFLPGNRAQDFKVCRLTEKCRRGHAGWTWFELKKWREEQARDTNAELLTDMKLRLEARERIAAHRKAAVAETEADLDGRRPDVKSVRENREDEKRLMRAREAEEARRLIKLNGAEKPRQDMATKPPKMSRGEEALFNYLEEQQAPL